LLKDKLLEIRQLRYFKFVADARSFAAAAQKLRVAQPALSRSIAKLEDELQCRLFIRHSAGVSLTDDGTKLYEHAESMLERLQGLIEDMSAGESEPQGQVRLGSPRSVQSQFIVSVASDFIAQFSSCRLDLVENSGARLRGQLLDASLDLAIFPGGADAGMHITPLVREKICLICRTQDRSKFGYTLTLDELLPLPLILTGYPNSLKLSIERRAVHLVDQLIVRSEVNSSAALVDLVIAGAGYGIAPACVVAQCPEALSCVPVDQIEVEWVIATNWSRRGLAAVRRIEEMLIAAAHSQVKAGLWPMAEII
jgi:LysR family transcriptional regulator, nitrogen assimilation regulatory protein